MSPALYLLPLLALILGVSITPLVRHIARRRQWLALPVADRWHKQSTALMGGIAIYAAISLPLLLLADFTTFMDHLLPHQAPAGAPSLAGALWLGVTLLFVLGLVDDFLRIKPHTKLIGQILVAALMAFWGFRLQWVNSLTLDTMLTIFWLVGLTNAFNLLDNMDGLCAGIGMLAALCLGLIFYPQAPEPMLISLVLAAALAAFLCYNFNPASIFMGDCGSLSIGFTVAMLGLTFSREYAISSFSAWCVPILLVMIPILDTTLVTLIRLLSGRKASTGGKDHTSHRLVLLGFSEKRAVLLLWTAGAISGLAAFFVSRTDTLTSPSVIIPVLLAILLLGVYLSQIRVYPEKEFSMLRDRKFTPILLDLTYKRQLLLVVLDFGLVAFAYYLSYRLRFDSADFAYYFDVFLRSLPAVIACKLGAFFIMGVYRGIWGFLSSNDILIYLKAATLGTLLAVGTVTFLYRFEDFSKGIFVIDWLLTTGLLLAGRGFFRISGDVVKRQTLCGKPVLIYGAGRGGELLLRELLNNPLLQRKPVGFIDDDPLKIGKKLQGYPVLGNLSDLSVLVPRHGVSGILISFKEPEDVNSHTILQTFCRKNALSLQQFDIQLKNVL